MTHDLRVEQVPFDVDGVIYTYSIPYLVNVTGASSVIEYDIGTKCFRAKVECDLTGRAKAAKKAKRSFLFL